MRNVMLIARRELAAYLRTMSGYVIIAAVLFVLGVLFNAYAMAGTAKKSSDILADFFTVASGLTMICSVLALDAAARRRAPGGHHSAALQLAAQRPRDRARQISLVAGVSLHLSRDPLSTCRFW